MDNNTSQDKRQSNIELLRILAMLFIIAYHFVYHGDVYYPHVDISGFNRIFTTFLRPFGKMGVNIFVMISGYFLIASQKKQYTSSYPTLAADLILFRRYCYCTDSKKISAVQRTRSGCKVFPHNPTFMVVFNCIFCAALVFTVYKQIFKYPYQGRIYKDACTYDSRFFHCSVFE